MSELGQEQAGVSGGELASSKCSLTIIIVSYNTKEITQSCLRSVFENSVEGMQVVVVDNDSEDGSGDMVQTQFPEVVLIRNDKNRGFAAANNQAIAVATGEYILLLNSDTVVLGDVMEESLRYMNRHPGVGVLGCRVLNPDRSMQPTCFMFPSIFNMLLLVSGLDRLSWPYWCGRTRMNSWQRDSEREVDVVTGCYMMVRRDAVDEVGMLDESFFFFGEETDWCYRFWQAGWKVVFSPIGEIVHIGNASGRKFEHRRDLMLSESKLYFHRKHHGPLVVVVIKCLMIVFCMSRLTFWSVARLLRRDQKSVDRLTHFKGLCFGIVRLRGRPEDAVRL